MRRREMLVTSGALLLSAAATGVGWSDELVPGTTPVLDWPEATYGGPVISGPSFQPEHTLSPMGDLRNDDPYFQAKGIPIDGLRLFPSLSTAVSYDDNVFRAKDMASSDVFF